MIEHAGNDKEAQTSLVDRIIVVGLVIFIRVFIVVFIKKARKDDWPVNGNDNELINHCHLVQNNGPFV